MPEAMLLHTRRPIWIRSMLGKVIKELCPTQHENNSNKLRCEKADKFIFWLTSVSRLSFRVVVTSITGYGSTPLSPLWSSF
jgi:hypothetical protein